MGSALESAIVDGILTGSVYALMAAGLTLIFGVMDIINIAQGILVVLGAYLSYVLQTRLGIDIFVGLTVTIPFMFVLGAAIDWAFLRRLTGRQKTAMSILVTYGVALIIEGILNVVFGVNYVQLHAWYVTRTFHFLGAYFPYIYVFGFGLSALLLAAIYAMLYRTRFGASVRASLQDRTAARLVGVDVDRVATISFGIGVAVTAAGGMIFGATNAFNANSSEDLISRLLTIVILGGLGSMGGALAAAIFMVTLEDVVAVLWSPIWSTAVFFIVLVLVLSLRPRGLFGQPAARAE